jgi:acetate CoA/acetoacetate CoA-transferase beta subunit
MIVTELAVIDVIREGLVLREIAAGLTVEDVQKVTAAELKVDSDLRAYAV